MLSSVRRFNFPVFSRYRIPVLGALLLIVSLLAVYQVLSLNSQRNTLSNKISAKDLLIASLSARARSLEFSYNFIANDATHAELSAINQVIDKYQVVKDKAATYKSQGVDTSSVDSQFPLVVDEILSGKDSEADSLLTTLDGNLETLLQAKLAADAKAAAAKKTTSSVTASTCSQIPSSGYCHTTVNGFTVDVITASLSSVEVITDSASSTYCADNCPTKSLLSYVQANGGYAGINGTYFCPPDYSSCAGKTNSYDFPIYNSLAHKWVFSDNDERNLLWTNRAGITFTASAGQFYEQSASISASTPIEAGIVNYPGLVNNGTNIVGNYSLTSSQNTKGYRGGVGFKGGTIYLVIARSASVNDLANIFVALGVNSALNLDGGGSSALVYNGAYKVGPGRSLPNALILK